jgi:hypothetical protein
MLPDLSNMKTKSTGASSPLAVDVAHAVRSLVPESAPLVFVSPPGDVPFPTAPLLFVFAPN